MRREELPMNQNSFLQIRGRKIGVGHPCFVVAELSGNHHQKYEEAVELVKAAADAGADAASVGERGRGKR